MALGQRIINTFSNENISFFPFTFVKKMEKKLIYNELIFELEMYLLTLALVLSFLGINH